MSLLTGLQGELSNEVLLANPQVGKLFDQLLPLDPKINDALLKAIAKEEEWLKIKAFKNHTGPMAFSESLNKSLLGTIAASRIKIALGSVGQDRLLPLCKAATNNDARMTLESLYPAIKKVSFWNPANEELLDDEKVEELKSYAAFVAASRIINNVKLQDIDKLAKIATNDLTALKQFSLDDTFIKSLNKDHETKLIDLASFQSLKLQLPQLVKTNNERFIHQWLKKDYSFANKYPNLNQEYKDKLRSLIAEELLVQRLQQQTNIESLKLIANATDLEATKTNIAKAFSTDINLDSMKNAVTATNLNRIQSLAALQAVQQTIRSSSDSNSLRALAQASTAQEVAAALENLNFSGETNRKLRNAFTDQNLIKSIATAAEIKGNLIRKAKEDPLSLEALINDPTSGYINLFKPANEESYKNYLAVENNQQAIKEFVFLNTIKHKLQTLGKVDLEGIVNKNKTVLPKIDYNDSTIKNIIKNVDVQQTIAAHASKLLILDFVNKTNNKDFLIKSLSHSEVIENIHFSATTGTHLENLPEADRYEIDEALVTAYLKNRIEDIKLKNQTKDIKFLTAVANADSVEALKDVFKDENIIRDNNAWLNEKSKEILQGIAADSLLENSIDQVQPGLNVRPALKNLVKQLTTENKTTLATTPALLNKLLKAQTAEEVGALIPVWKKKNEVAAYIAENQALNRCLQVQNALIGRVLYQKGIGLTADQLNELNDNIKKIETLKETLGFLGLSIKRPKLAEEIFNFTTSADKKYIDQAGAWQKSVVKEFFGFEIPGKQINFEEYYERQKQYNKEIQKQLEKTTSIPEKVIAAMLLAIPKNAEMGWGQVDFIKKEIEKNASKEEFVKELAKNNAPLAREIDFLLTENQFNDIKNQLTKDKRAQATITELADELDKEQDSISKNQMMNVVSRSQVKTRENLQEIAKMTDLNWLNPVFGGTAKRLALAAAPHFERINEVCEKIQSNLRHNRKVLQEDLKRLPDADALSSTIALKRVEKHRKFLQDAIDKINAELHIYNQVELRLKGDESSDDPYLKAGILASINEAKKAEKAAIFTTFGFTTSTCDAKDINLEIREKFKDEPESQNPQNPKELVQVTTSLKRVPYEPSIKASTETAVIFSRKNLVTPQQPSANQGKIVSHSCIAETRTARDSTAHTVNGKVYYDPAVTLTLVKAPVDDEILVRDCLFMACRLVSGLDFRPNNDKPIVIADKGSVEYRKFLWTALREVLKIQYGRNFDPKGLQFEGGTPPFEPDDELGKMWGYSDNSVFTQHFKDHGKYKTLRVDYQEFVKDKQNAEKVHDKIAPKYLETSREYREELEAVRKGNTPPGPGNPNPSPKP